MLLASGCGCSACALFSDRALRCAGWTHLAERERNNIDYGSLAVDISKPSDDNQCAVLSFLTASRLVVSAREVFEVSRLRQMMKH